MQGAPTTGTIAGCGECVSTPMSYYQRQVLPRLARACWYASHTICVVMGTLTPCLENIFIIPYSYYHYYHCTSACGCRFKASLANTLFVDQLKQYISDQDVVDMYKHFIISEYGDMTKYHRDERNTTLTQITELNDRLNKVRQKLFMEQIDLADFKLMKAECETA